MRIAVIGNSGSGKSTLARQLAAVHALASLDLDTIAWDEFENRYWYLDELKVSIEPLVRKADRARETPDLWRPRPAVHRPEQDGAIREDRVFSSCVHPTSASA
jgi:energy-coupling factor transporter ATP-binding protein EcfA2